MTVAADSNRTVSVDRVRSVVRGALKLALEALKGRYAVRTTEDALALVKDRKSADSRTIAGKAIYRRLRA